MAVAEEVVLDVREGSFDITPVSSCFYIAFDAIRTPDTCLSSANVGLKKCCDHIGNPIVQAGVTMSE